MSQLRTRRAGIGGMTLLAIVAALPACGQDPGAVAAPAATATASNQVAPAQSEQSASPPSDPTASAPQPSDPSLAPRLRQQVRSIPLVQRFVKFWNINPKGIWSNTFQGVRTIQNPLDVWITQEIMYEVKPDFVIEAGTLYGGSAPLWAMFLEQFNPEGRVITIDIKDNVRA